MFRKKNPATELRDKQIEGLRQYTKARPINPEETMWDVDVETAFGVLKFRVILPPGFPERPPQLCLLVKGQHKWVQQVGNQFLITGHPKLQNWSVHYSLGQVVNEISMEFQKSPPAPITSQPQPPQSSLPPQSALNAPAGPVGAPMLSPRMASPPPRPVSPMMPLQGSPSPFNGPDQKTRTQIPRVPDRFDDLDAFNTEKLRSLLNSEAQLQAYIDDLSDVKSFRAVVDELYSGLEDLAKKNLSRKQEVDTLRGEVEALRQESEAKGKLLQDLQQRQNAVAQRFSTVNLMRALDGKVREADDQSEDVKAKLLRELVGQSDEAKAKTLVEFTQEYIKLRSLYHLRAEKKERMLEGQVD